MCPQWHSCDMHRSSISEFTRRCCSLRGEERTYKFKADDEGMAGRWVTALRAVQISCTIAYVAARLVVLCCLVQCYCVRFRALVVSPLENAQQSLNGQRVSLRRSDGFAIFQKRP